LFNYQRFQKITGLPLVSEPNLVIEDFGLSCFVLVYGFKKGTFTGRKITDYIGNGKVDFIGARRCINGTDRDSLIAGYARDWLKQLPRYMSMATGNFSPTATPNQVSQPLINSPKVPITVAGSYNLTFNYEGFESNGVTANIKGSGVKLSGNTLPSLISLTTLRGLGTLISEVTGSNIVFEGDDKAVEKVVLSSKPAIKVLSELCELHGKKLVVAGNKIEIKDKDTVDTWVLSEVVDYTVSDVTVNSMAKSGDTALGMPSKVLLPNLGMAIQPGDRVECKYLPPNRVWLVSSVTITPSTIELSVSVPIVSDKVKQLTQQQQQQQSSVVAVTQGTSSGLANEMLQSAVKNRGEDTAKSGLNGGRLACAWAVNRFVLEPVFGRKFGSLPNLVLSVERDMKLSGFKAVSASQAKPGYIAVAMRRDSGGAHIGVVIRSDSDPIVLSNSSSKAAFLSEYHWEQVMGRTYAPCRFAYYQPPSTKGEVGTTTRD